MDAEGDVMIKRDDLTEIRCFFNPHPDVITVVTTTLNMLGHKNARQERNKDVSAYRWLQDWVQAIRLLNMCGKDSVLNRMKDFNKDSVPLKVAKKARMSLKDVSPENLQKISKAAYGMFLWTQSKIERVLAAGGEGEETST